MRSKQNAKCFLSVKQVFHRQLKYMKAKCEYEMNEIICGQSTRKGN